MHIWVKFSLDYEFLNTDTRKIMEKISKIGPPIVQKTEKSYSNSILIHQRLNMGSESQKAKIKSKILKETKVILKKIKLDKRFKIHKKPIFNSGKKLTLAEATYCFAIVFTLHSFINNIDEDCELLRKSLFKNESCIENIFVYINNYLLFADNMVRLKECVEKIIVYMAHYYFQLLLKIPKLDTQLKYAENDFVVLVQYCCSDNKQFANIARK